ncbi:MarR family transcriptional regulator [uncultured Rhodospira sp.]|uniref:MarR family winged helix-turn-helix transcriptional regulator n=1 Tax=uncultured Rhodospira sp. TaxID=1936189 RepID=UPI0026380D57|nr:MarR family transcriptional regulator [uncultured Rhodospira sp.]
MTELFVLDRQVGFLLRKAHQRHLSLFSDLIDADLTPMQFAVLAKLEEVGPTSQNRLGRLTAMDVATIKGVVGRLEARGLVERRAAPHDRRMAVIEMTEEGRDVLQRSKGDAVRASRQALAPLSDNDRSTLMELLARIT